MSKRVSELTKEIGKTNKEVLNLLRNKGVNIKDARYAVSDEDVEYVKNYYKAIELKEARKAEQVELSKKEKQEPSKPFFNRTEKRNTQDKVVKNTGEQKSYNKDRNNVQTSTHTHRNNTHQGGNMNKKSLDSDNKNEETRLQGTSPRNQISENQGKNQQTTNLQHKNNRNSTISNNRNNRNAEGNSAGNQQQGDNKVTSNINNSNNRNNSNMNNRNNSNTNNNMNNRNTSNINNNIVNRNNGNTNNNVTNRNNNSTNNNVTNRNNNNTNNNVRNRNNNNTNNNVANRNNNSTNNNVANRNNNNAGNNTGNRNNSNTNNINSRNNSSINRSNNNNNGSGNNNNRNVNNNNNNNNRNNSNNKNNRSNSRVNNKNNNNNRNNTKPQTVQVQEVKEPVIRTITLPEKLTLKELADKVKVSPSQLVKQLFLKGTIVTINHELTFSEAEEIALEYNCIAEEEKKVNVIEEILKEEEEDEKNLVKRPPIVCVMGHVDHGKTSLLDAIRETSVTEKETGGITQHIGAYVVDVDGEKITFLDTPGHEAFTAMRMRGAKSTDIAILVVAADDGVMPQTVEAINHARAAGIEIIVAINKIDKPSANIERVKQELTEYELIAEDWGGNTVFVPVSAHTKEGIPQLLEMIILTAEICEFKANPNRKARGIVIEAELDKGKGSVATVLVQKGILKVGDSIAVGAAFGKVRAMMDYKGKRLKEAGPSMPVEILGLNEVPFAGEIFIATDNDKEARVIAEAFITHGREKLLDDTKAKLSLDDLYSQIQAGNVKELNIVVKADVQGSVEAVKQSLLKLSNDEVVIKIIHGGVGAINESDVILASASNAIIIGFNVRPDNTAKSTAEREKVDLRLYGIIYNAIEDIESAMKGMLDPTFEEKIQGHAEVRQIFKASGIGTIAGSYVLDGIIVRNSGVRIIRDSVVVFSGTLASVKRFSDDVKEVKTGYECGLVIEKYNDIKEGDIIETFTMEEIPR